MGLMFILIWEDRHNQILTRYTFDKEKAKRAVEALDKKVDDGDVYWFRSLTVHGQAIYVDESSILQEEDFE